MSYAIMRIQKIKSMQALRERERHNTRNKTVLSADNSKNINVIGQTNLVPKVEALEKEINKTSKRKTRKDAIRTIEILFTSDKSFFKRVDADQYFELCSEWLEETFGRNNVLQKSIHCDEEVEHMHCILTTIKDGKFNYSGYVGGRQDLRALQDSFFKKVEHLGLERGQKAEITQAKYTSTKEWHKKVQSAEEKVKALSPENRFDYAVKGVLAEEEQKALQDKILNLNIDNMELEEKLTQVKTRAQNSEKDLKALREFNKTIMKGAEKNKDKQLNEIIRQQRKKMDKSIEKSEELEL